MAFNPVGDVIKSVNRTLDNVDVALAKVDDRHVDQKMDGVDHKMVSVDERMVKVDEALATVCQLLDELQGEIELLRQVPDMQKKLDAIHAAVASP